ncbi:MAG: PDZ domain-containing protein, partial [Dethiobacteria bacterium]
MDKGSLISGVTPGSPAGKAGLEAGDRLISINGSRFYDILDYY